MAERYSPLAYRRIRHERSLEPPRVRPPRVREAPAPAGPIQRLLELFRDNGREPEFERMPQERWQRHATEQGLLFVAADFAAAWRMAVQAGLVVPLEGAPKRDRQSKRVDLPPAAQELPIAPRRKATGA